MDKAEADAILERDTGPIEPHLQALASLRSLPDYAIGMCTLRVEEAAPALRSVLEKAAASGALSENESRLLLRGVYILGGGRDQQSFQPFLRLLRRPDDELYELLGDTMSASLPQIIAGMFNGDSDGLLAGILDRSVSGRARAAMLGAATFLAWNGKMDRERFKQFLVALPERPRADDEDEVWVAWVMAIGLHGFRDLAPIVKAAWAEGRIPDGVMEWRHFEQDLRDAERAPDDIGRFHSAELGYLGDALEALDWTRTGDDERSFAEERRPGHGYVPDMPIINPNRGVGRNDPCPCGSGKKYKKCCLGV